MAEYLQEIHCRGCRRIVGMARNDMSALYCDLSCVEDYPASNTEARDALMEAMYLTQRPTLADLGKMFGFTRQRAHQIVSERDIRKQ
jgi:hypothetical protein